MDGHPTGNAFSGRVEVRSGGFSARRARSYRSPERDIIARNSAENEIHKQPNVRPAGGKAGEGRRIDEINRNTRYVREMPAVYVNSDGNTDDAKNVTIPKSGARTTSRSPSVFELRARFVSVNAFRGCDRPCPVDRRARFVFDDRTIATSPVIGVVIIRAVNERIFGA